MRKFLLSLLIILLIPAAYIAVGSYSHADLGKLPPLESGDLIFQTSVNNQTLPIIAATGSFYTHIGIVRKNAEGYSVIHAAQKVIESPLAEFITYGWGEKFTVKRYAGLTPAQSEAVAKAARTYLGREYDYVFHLKDDRIYCSELPYFAYRSQHILLGAEQKISELNMNNPFVRKLFEARWKRHPACQDPAMTYDACWRKVLDEPIITPISLARDSRLTTLYSNYLF